MRKLSGFTLIELMVAIAVIATLITALVPSYQAFAKKARRSDALIALEQAAARQEQHYFLTHRYTDELDNLGGDNDLLLSPQGYYQLVALADARTFTLIATPVEGGVQSTDTDCLSIRLSYTGTKEPVVCWR